MRNQSKKKLLLLVINLFFVKVLSADYSFLNMPIESNQLSLGGAGTASFFGTSAIKINPGSIGFNKDISAELSYQVLNEDFHANSALLLYPITPDFSVGGFFSTVYLTDSFAQIKDFKTTDSQLSVSDIEVGFSAGYKLLKDLSIGTNLRFIRMQLGLEIAQGFGADIGAYYNLHLSKLKKTQYKTLSIGAVIKNIGPSIQFVSSGEKDIQPMTFKIGLAYGPLKWLNAYADYAYSWYEGISYYFATEYLSDFYVSPRIGVKYDFNGLTVSTGATLQYGKGYKLKLIGGTSFGEEQESNSFISLQFSKYGFSNIRPIKKTYTNIKIYSLKQIQDYYQPFLLYPSHYKIKIEKVQGVLLNQTSTTGFSQRTWKLRRVALQPEDDPFVKELMAKNIKQIKLNDRKMGLWLQIKGIEEQTSIDWWDYFSNIIQASTDFEVLFGENLERLNKNPNAPLKYEFKLILINDKENKSIIKTRLYEMYSNQMLFSKSFVVNEEKDKFNTLKKISDFYSTYLKSIKGFYKLKTLYNKKDSI